MTDTQFTVLMEIQSSSLKRQIQQALERVKGFAVLSKGLEVRCDLLIHELGSSPDRDFAAIQSFLDSGTVGEVFLISASTDQEILLRSIKAGVREFFTLPVQDEELVRALDKFKSRRGRDTGSAPSKAGRVISVIGSKGGAGTTTIAVNLAAALRQQKAGRSVLLMDMNMHMGGVPLFLDFSPQYTWQDLAKDVKRMDETFLGNVVFEHQSGLCILPGPEYVNGHALQLLDVFESLFTLLGQMFDAVVVDCGCFLHDLVQEAARRSDTVLVVSQLSLPYLANASKMLDLLIRMAGVSEQAVHVILNRYGKKADMSVQDAEKSLQSDIFWSIPNDYQFAMSSINQGKTFNQIGPRHKLTQNMQQLAGKLMPEAGADKRKWFFR